MAAQGVAVHEVVMLIRLALYVSGHRPTIDRVSSPVEGAARSLAEGEPEEIVVRVIDDRAIVIGAPSGAKRSRWDAGSPTSPAANSRLSWPPE